MKTGLHLRYLHALNHQAASLQCVRYPWVNLPALTHPVLGVVLCDPRSLPAPWGPNSGPHPRDALRPPGQGRDLPGWTSPWSLSWPGPDWNPTRDGRRGARGGSHLADCVRPPPPGRAEGRGSGRAGPGAEAGLGKLPPSGPLWERRGEARRGWADRHGKGKPRGPGAALRQPGCSCRTPSAEMGLETEKADVQLFMDEDSYSRHSSIDYADPEKFVDPGSDRDPHRLNSHLKVKPGAGPTLDLRLTQAPAKAWEWGCPL